MSCKDNNNHKRNKDNNCVSDVVKFINELQDCATNTCPTGCDVPFLGANPNVPLANTRPFLLYLPNGELFRVPAFLNNMRDRNDNRNDDNNDNNDKNRRNNCQDSVVFRVESVDDDCAVLRALVGADRDNNKNNNNNKDRQDFCDLVDAEFFVASNTCITVDLDAFVAIQCLRDVHVNNL